MARVTGMSFLLAMLLAPDPCPGQSGFAADRLEIAPSGEGLAATQSPHIEPGRLEAFTGADWSYHLLGLRGVAGPDPVWIVEHRLSLRGAVSFSPAAGIRLGAGFSGALVQEGLRSNEVGAWVPVSAAMGSSCFFASWSFPGLESFPVQAGMTTTLLLPTAEPDGLTGSERVDLRLLLLLETRVGLLRPLVNLGIVTRDRTRFYDLLQDDGFVFLAGVELGKTGWPVLFSAELVGEAPLTPGAAESLEGLLGFRIRRVAGIDLTLGTGFALSGTGVPTVRGLVLVRFVSRAEKRAGKPE